MEWLLDDGVGRAFFYLRGRLIREGDGGYWKEGLIQVFTVHMFHNRRRLIVS